jgi:uncharacterized protein YjiS (DUF1127 family)
MEKAMSILIKSRQAEFPSFLDSLIKRVAEFMARQMRALLQRRALGQLTRLDNRMLHDIGLSRNDIDAAESLPRGSDPITLLASLRRCPKNAGFADSPRSHCPIYVNCRAEPFRFYRVVGGICFGLFTSMYG